MKRLVLFAVLVLLVVGVVFAYNYVTAPREEVVYSYTFDESYELYDETADTGKAHAAGYLYARDGKSWMYDGIIKSSQQKAAKPVLYALVNGKLLPMDDPKRDTPTYVANQHTIIVPRSKGRSLVFLDGRLIGSIIPEVENVKSTEEYGIVLTTKSGEAYEIVNGKLKKRPQIDNEDLKSPARLRTVKRDGKMLLVKDGKEIDSGVYIDPVSVPGGKRIAYWRSLDGDNWSLIVDGKEQPNSRSKMSGWRKDKPTAVVHFDEHGKRYYYIIYKDKKAYLYNEAGLLDSAPTILGTQFLHDGKIAYTTSQDWITIPHDSVMHAKIDGRDLYPGHQSRILAISQDLRRMAVVKVIKPARRSSDGNEYEPPKEQVFVDGKPAGPVLQNIQFSVSTHLLFSLNGKHLAYKALKPERIVFDGKIVTPQHDRIGYPEIKWYRDSIGYWTIDSPGRYSVDHLPKGTRLQYVRVRFRD